MIIDFANLLLYGAFTGLIIGMCAAIAIRFYIPKLIENEKLTLKNDLEKWINSETGQKAVYMLGGLAAAGMKGGLGLNIKGGKFKIENILAELFGRYAQEKILPKLLDTPQNTPNLPDQAKKIVDSKHLGYKSKY